MTCPLYVTLDTLVPNDSQDPILVKRVSEDYKNKTFLELIEHMCDGGADELNLQPYNAQEMRVVSAVQDSLHLDSEKGHLFALSVDTPPQEIKVKLEDQIDDYNDRIIKTETETGPSGEELNYQKLELIIPYNGSSKENTNPSKENPTNNQTIRRFLFVDVFNAYNREERFSEMVDQEKLPEIPEKAKRGEIGFRKIKNSQYEVSVTLSPYIIEKDGEYFAFDAVTLGTTIRARNNQVMISDPPRVLSLPYKHPHVFERGNISYGCLRWRTQRGVEFNHWYNLSNKKAIARKIAIVMRQGKLTMERGYVGHNIIPVHTIQSLNCKIADNRAAAEQYAKEHGMPLERIIKND